MRKLVLLLCFWAMALSMVAQGHWDSHFVVDVSANFTVGKDGESNGAEQSFRNFRGTTVSGSYKWFLHKGFFIKPGVSVYYENHDIADDAHISYGVNKFNGVGLNSNGRRDWDNHSSEFGMGVSAMLGYCLPYYNKNVSIDIMTGPYYSYAIDQHDTWRGLHYMNYYNRSSFRWRFGVGLNVWKISVGLSYDLSMLGIADYTEDKEKNVLNVSIGYNF